MGSLTKTQSQELDTITDTEVIEVGKVILLFCVKTSSSNITIHSVSYKIHVLKTLSNHS